MTEIGKRIKGRRKALGITQEELAKMLGYKNKSSIAKIETGVNDIVQSKVVEFAKALQTTVAYLMGWEAKNISIPNSPPQINSIIAKAQQLNSEDLEKVNNYIDDLVSSGKYGKSKIDKRAT